MRESADRIPLCRLDEIRVPGCRGLTVTCDDGVHEILLVRSADGVFGYLNSCPHTGAPLDWVPGQFLNLDTTHIQCSTHAALFNFHDGVCIAGPCLGEALAQVPLLEDSGAVYLLQRKLLIRQPSNGS